MGNISLIIKLALICILWSVCSAAKTKNHLRQPNVGEKHDNEFANADKKFLNTEAKSKTKGDEDVDNLSRKEVIAKIYERVLERQLQEGDFMAPVDDPGLFTSKATLHIIDEENSEELHNFRQTFSAVYNIAFNSTLVLLDLLEMERLGMLTLDNDSMTLAWEAMLKTRSKNFPDGTAIFNFSGQAPYFGALGRLTGYHQPIPLNNEMNMLWDLTPPELREKWYERNQTVITARARMPADLDSTSLVMAAVGMIIENGRTTEYEMLQEAITSWNALSHRITQATYRPFVNWNYNPDAVGPGERDTRDIIDSRSYYTLHPFFKKKMEEALEKGETPDVRVIDSWLINQSEIIPEVMELILINANETDSVVYFSFLRGVTALVLTGADMLEDLNQSDFFTDDLQHLYLNAAEAMLWMVESGMMNDHPDIISMYPEMDIPYAHVGKLLQWLRVYNEADIPYDVIIKARDILITIAEDNWTNDILDKIIIDEDAQEAYCDGVLGAYNGKSWKEDRLYKTAFYVDSLVSYWTVRDGESSLAWLDSTPSEVKKVAAYAGNYVTRVALDEETSLQGCLYAVGEDSVDDQPYRWPVNVHEYLNGTTIDPHTTDLTTVDLVNLSWNVQGYIDDDTYQDMLENQEWFQKKTCTEFRGFNNPENSNSFYYFYSEAVTLSHAALLLAQLEILNVEQRIT